MPERVAHFADLGVKIGGVTGLIGILPIHLPNGRGGRLGPSGSMFFGVVGGGLMVGVAKLDAVQILVAGGQFPNRTPAPPYFRGRQNLANVLK